MTLPADDAAAPDDSRTAEQRYPDARLSAASERRKEALFARMNAARQLADYMVSELHNVAVTPEETASQLAQYRSAIVAQKIAYDRYVAADVHWFRD